MFLPAPDFRGHKLPILVKMCTTGRTFLKIYSFCYLKNFNDFFKFLDHNVLFPVKVGETKTFKERWERLGRLKRGCKNLMFV